MYESARNLFIQSCIHLCPQEAMYGKTEVRMCV